MRVSRIDCLILTLGLVCGSALASSVQPQIEEEPNFIAGKWEWVSRKDGCVEMYDYRDDHNFQQCFGPLRRVLIQKNPSN